ncbi:hypothetical protein J2X86_002440 [Acinetobacter lwoffii]|jgi:hypothetical protein|uniref:Uncharacterized protein n=1 Tax=Acinetobacter lwoffii TaxID=28090 RepID=A0AAW8LCL3_ACILW|nr:hypothetical protein [Acinetobacter lwoffii]MDR6630385.1 hypothetical protein [Acinetobacter lwoffii]
MRLSPVDQHGQYQDSEAGTIASLSDQLFNEYGLSGYSLTPSDIETALIADFKVYAGWVTTATQARGQGTTLDGTQSVELGEWAILETVIRAHCELIQAQRMEATASLGGERFGLSVSEASQKYSDAKLEAEKKAFIEEPFFIDFGG